MLESLPFPGPFPFLGPEASGLGPDPEKFTGEPLSLVGADAFFCSRSRGEISTFLTMLEQLWTVARNTFTESIRQPIYMVLLLLVSGLLGMSPAFTAYTLEDDNKLLLDLGLSSIFLGGLFLAAFTTAGVLDREIRNRTVMTVLSKPIARATFILGKFLGVLGAIVTAHWVWSLVFLLSARHGVLMRASDVVDRPVLIFGLGAVAVALATALYRNYLRGRVFASALTYALVPCLTVAYMAVLFFDRRWHPQPPVTDLDPQLLLALLLVLEGLAILSAVAVAASTRLGQMLTLTACSVVLILGLTSNTIFGGFRDSSFLARAGYVMVPNLQFMWLADALTQENPVSGSYVAMVTLYTLLYIVAFLAIAVALFQTRDVG